MTKHVASTTKKFLAAGGLAFGLAGLGLLGGVGIAAADQNVVVENCVDMGDGSPPSSSCTHETPDEGSYDELLNIVDEDGFQSYIASSYPADASWPGGNAKP